MPPAPTRWKAFEKAKARLERLEAERTDALEQARELEEELKRAQNRDRVRLADALERGRREPDREAVKAEKT